MPAKSDYYRTPLRSRKAIADHLASIGGYYSTSGRRGRSYFRFNVKCHGVRLDFEHLVEVYRVNDYHGDGVTWLENQSGTWGSPRQHELTPPEGV